MSDFPTTHLSLLLRLQDHGNATAWQEFVEVYEPVLLSLVKRRGLQESDAREIVQEAMLAVAKHIDRFEHSGDSGHFRSWLSRIIRNLTINLLTRLPLGAKGIGDSVNDELLNDIADCDKALTDEYDLVQEREIFAIAAEKVQVEVQEKTWSAFWMTCVEDKSVPEVSKLLQMTPGAIYVARSRVVAKLRQTIQTMGFLPS
jgi:RNA polymerase sigma factor (sigma-70 family)